MTAPMNVHRYPIGPLFAAMRVDPDFGRRELGMSGSSYGTFVQHGLTEAQADRYATRAGLNAYSVWPEMVDDVIADVMHEAVGPLGSFVVRCIECGRPVTCESMDVESPRRGVVRSSCPAGHPTTVTLEVA